MNAGPSNPTSHVTPTAQTYEDLIVEQCARLNEMQPIDKNGLNNKLATPRTQLSKSATHSNRSLYIGPDETSITSSVNLVPPIPDADMEAMLRAHDAAMDARRKNLRRRVVQPVSGQRGNCPRTNGSTYSDTDGTSVTNSANLGLPTMEAEIEAEIRAHEAMLRGRERSLRKSLTKMGSSLIHRMRAKAKHICCCLKVFVKMKIRKEGKRSERGKGVERQGGEEGSEVDSKGEIKEGADGRRKIGDGDHETCALDGTNHRAEDYEPPCGETRHAVRTEDHALHSVQTSTTVDTISTTLSQALQGLNERTEPEHRIVVVGRATRPVGVGEGARLVHQESEVRSVVPSILSVQEDPRDAYPRSEARSYEAIRNWLLHWAPRQVEPHARQDLARCRSYITDGVPGKQD